MSKAKKSILLVILGLLFVLAIAIATTSPAAFAATEEEPTGYYFKVGDQVVENNTYPLKRGTTTDEITYWNDGVQQQATLMIMPQTLAATYLTLDNNRILAKKDIPLSFTLDDTPYIVCLSTNGLTYLYIKIVPDDTLSLYNMGYGPFTFVLRGVNDIQTFDGVTEKVSATCNVRNSAGEILVRSCDLKDIDSNICYLDGSALSGYYLSSNLYIETVSLTYSYGTQRVTYNVEDYPMLFGIKDTVAYTYFTSGDGSRSDPYTIASYIQLNNVRYAARYEGRLGGYAITTSFKLVSDITMSNSSGTKFETIYEQFHGTFDGNGHKIINLHLENTGAGDYGLFRHVASTGVVKNLIMENAQISIYSESPVRIGAIAAYNYGTVTNCEVSSGTLFSDTQQSSVGGIVGSNAGGTVSVCTNRAEVIGCGNVGGIVGVNSLAGTVSNCKNEGTVTLELRIRNSTYYTGNAGGIVGRNNTNADITDCDNNGKIVYGGPANSSSQIQPNMAQIVGWLESGSQQRNKDNGSTDYSLLSDSQKAHCSTGIVGKTGA